jgi:hypothetical protein
LFNEYAKKHGVPFIDRKESDPLYGVWTTDFTVT